MRYRRIRRGLVTARRTVGVRAFLLVVLCFLPVFVGQAGPTETYRDGVVYPLQSKIHAWVMYESRTQTMTSSQKGRAVTEFYDVPRDVFVGFLESHLKGGYFRANIEGRYATQQLSR